MNTKATSAHYENEENNITSIVMKCLLTNVNKIKKFKIDVDIELQFL